MDPRHWLYSIPLRVRTLFRRGRVEQELDEELQFHLEQRERQLEARGLTPAEARRQARLAFDGVERCKEECRDARRVNLADDFVQDLAHGARLLQKTPAFTITAVVTIAIGVGAAAAMFSVTNTVLLRPLPYRNADRLAIADPLLSNAWYHDLRASDAFDELASVMVFRAVVPREDGTAERISKGLVSTNFLPMMGAHIAFGRDFAEADGQPHSQPPPPFPPPQGKVAILSYEYFQRRYHGDASVLGREMLATGGIAGPRIIGVVERGFQLRLPTRIGPQPTPDVWIANDRGYDAPHRDGLMLNVLGIRKAGMTLDAAQARIDRALAASGAQAPRVRLLPLQKTLVAKSRPALLALMGAVTFLLTIACANVANLMLVRAAQREHELAMRAALGARSGRLMRQMSAEALLLAVLGTLAGIGIAWGLLREFIALAPANVPRLDAASIDWSVLAFAALAGLLEAALFGVIQGWRAARPDAMLALRGTGRNVGRREGRLRHAVVVGEVALSFVLLIGSGLMFRSFLELRRVDPGFDAQGLLTVLTVGDAQGFQQPDRRLGFLLQLRERLGIIPGVQSVGAGTGLPLSGGGPAIGLPWSTDRMTPDPSRTADLPTVLPGYFEALRSRVVAGRTFTEADNVEHRAVAVIDDSLAAKAFEDRASVGQQICVAIPSSTCFEVIGVVAHQRMVSLAERGRDQIYLPDGYWGIGVSRHWALRVTGDPAQYASAVRETVRQFAPGRFAITEMQTMDAIVDQAQTSTRFHLLLIGVFAAAAVVLAAVGLYGVLSSVVRQRTNEIGVRMALGADPMSVFKLVVGRGLALSGMGVGIGLAAAFGLTRAMTTMLVGIAPTDPLTFVATALLFFAIAAAASWIPARRAARLDPTVALREQ